MRCEHRAHPSTTRMGGRADSNSRPDRCQRCRGVLVLLWGYGCTMYSWIELVQARSSNHSMAASRDEHAARCSTHCAIHPAETRNSQAALEHIEMVDVCLLLSGAWGLGVGYTHTRAPAPSALRRWRSTLCVYTAGVRALLLLTRYCLYAGG